MTPPGNHHQPHPDTILETERLILRPTRPEDDFEPLARIMADAETVRYLGVEPMNRFQSWRNMAMVMGHWAIRGYGFFSVTLKSTGEWIGRVGPWYPEGWPGTEVGWTIAPWVRNKGYATEAARASMDYAFEELGWDQVIHLIEEGNEASVAVAQKLGSEMLYVLHGIPGITDDTLFIFGQNAPRASS